MTSSKTWLSVAAACIALMLFASLALISTLSTIVAGGAGSGDDPICVPGDGGESKVEIPEEYVGFVNDAAAHSGISSSIIGAQLKQESGFDPDAVSPAGAEGIAQFMPKTWESFGEGGDPFDPEDAIAAQGRYLKYLADFMEDHAGDDEQLVKLVLAGYNAGEGAVKNYDFNLDDMFNDASKPGYKNETKPYVENITAAAEGDYGVDCSHDGDGNLPEGELVETISYLAHDNYVSLSRSSAATHGRDAAKPEYVTEADKLAKPSTAYYTDCGVFVATVMRSSGVDSKYPKRGTSGQVSYVKNSKMYETFSAGSEADLEPGDILVKPGHTYMYTGERNKSKTGRAQGASLYTRPPSGHYMLLDGSYTVARFVG